MKRIKAIAVFLVLTLVLSLTVVSATTTKTITIQLAGIKIYVDGVKIDPRDGAGKAVEPFLYNGTVYLPVRAVGQAIGKDVNWDANTKTVYLGKKPDTSSPVETTTYGRTNPAPIGVVQTIAVDDVLVKYNANLKVEEVIEGEAAAAMIAEANMFNPKPESGKKYIVAKVTISVSDVQGDKAVSLNTVMFDCFSSVNKEYDRVIVVCPSPSFEGDIYNGSSLSGYVTFCVDTTDPAPKIVFARNYDGTGGAWFKLTA